jgi:hypothetical protein
MRDNPEGCGRGMFRGLKCTLETPCVEYLSVRIMYIMLNRVLGGSPAYVGSTCDRSQINGILTWRDKFNIFIRLCS